MGIDNDSQKTENNRGMPQVSHGYTSWRKEITCNGAKMESRVH